MNIKIKTDGLSINPDSPWESDKLDRFTEITALTRLLKNLDPPVVISIDSEWGRGKTSFIRLWEHHLLEHKIKSVYFNAWETDFSEEPLISFLGEINDKLRDATNGHPNLQEKWEKTKNFGVKIAKRTVPSFLRLATAGFVDVKSEDLGDFIGDVSEGIANEALDHYLNTKSEIEKFKESMEEIVKDALDSKLVIFVDELDRCRPSYAVELLERIKHIFDVKGLVFVLAVAKTQLCASIKSIYGDGIDSRTYLKKFIDIDYQLRSPPVNSFVEYGLDNYGIKSFLLNGDEDQSERAENIEKVSMLIKALSSSTDSSMRDINQALSHINIAFRSLGKSLGYPFSLLAFLSFVRTTLPDQYFLFRDSRLRGSLFWEKVEGLLPEKNFKENARDELDSQILYITETLGNVPTRTLNQHENYLRNNQRSDNITKYDFAVAVYNGQGKCRQLLDDVTLDQIFEVVEFSSSFS